MDKYTGKRLDGRYEIHELIGVGGMAVVYRAYDTIDDRIVAIKILKDEFADNNEFIRRFKNESKAIAVLSHKNIVKVYDVSFGDRIQYIVMEYIDGITLKDYLSHQKEIKWQEAVHFTSQILNALNHAHSKGVIHRDIKPQNIILLQDGTIKVTDFGIARFSKSKTRTMTDKAIGSVHYIAPEQARGDFTDEKADIYSVGVMLYEMTTGQLPFEADNAVSVAIMQLQTQPRKPRNINPSIPEGLEEITLKAMQKDPVNRYQSAEQMLSDLEKFMVDPGIKFDYIYNDNNLSQYNGDNINAARPEPEYDDNYNMNSNEISSGKNRKRNMMIITGIGIAVVLFALIFGIIAFTKSCGNSSKDIDIPNFVGLKLSDVQGNSKYKFTWKIETTYDATKAEGIILDQSPKAGAKKVKEGATITLTVNSSGTTVSVPSVKGLSQDSAKSKIIAAGLVCSEIREVEDSETAVGIVISSDPQEGTEVKVNTSVRLYVSKGASEKKVTIPNVINKSYDVAKKELESLGLKVNKVTEDSDKVKDTVISQDPLNSVEVAEGSTVTLTISTGETVESKKEKTVPVLVMLPSSVNYAVTVKTYVDGQLIDTVSVIPSNAVTYTAKVKGTTGSKTVKVTLNGDTYRIYTVNFDTEDVTVIEEREFNAGASSAQSSSQPSSNSSAQSSSNQSAQSSSQQSSSSQSSSQSSSKEPNNKV